MNKYMFNPCDECKYGINRRDGSGSDRMCKICEFQEILRCAQTENKPLTLDELREMDGEKIEIHYIGHCEGFYEDEIAPYYGDKEQYIQKYNGMLRACDLPLKYYGIGWTATAYRYKPEEANER